MPLLTRRVLLTAAVLLAATGCKTPEGKFQDLAVPTLADWQKQGAVKVYDVNADDFRAEHGKIPGAVLLASSKDYDLSLLPAQKEDKIAFYCSSRL